MILIALMMATPEPQGLDEFRSLLNQHDFLAAWEYAQAGLAPGLLLDRAHAEMLLKAGDPAGAYRVARLGLGVAPSDLELLHHEATAAVWIGDGRRGLDAATRLLSAIGEADLQPSAVNEWQVAAKRRIEESSALLAHAKELAHASSSARILSVVCFAVSVLAALIGIRGALEPFPAGPSTPSTPK